MTSGDVRVLVIAAVCFGPTAGAQDMDEGAARVSSRSDVEMEVRSGPATNAKRLAELAGVLGGALGPVKRCYARVLGEHPEVQGDLKLLVEVPERGKPSIEVTSDEVDHGQVVRCALRALRGVDYDVAPRPSAAFVHYTFVHSAAAGMEATRSRAAQREATVTRGEDGVPEARFTTPNGEVSYAVVGAEGDADERVLAGHRGMRSAVPGLLDCRRRAAKRGRSPEGEVRMQALVSHTGRARARVVRSTVASPRAGNCVVAAIRRTRFDREAAGRWTLRVRFAPYTDAD